MQHYTTPTTRTAWLPREKTQADPHPAPTLHVYDSTVLGKDHVGDPMWLHMFKCTVTGALRVWGCEGSRPNGSTAGDA